MLTSVLLYLINLLKDYIYIHIFVHICILFFFFFEKKWLAIYLSNPKEKTHSHFMKDPWYPHRVLYQILYFLVQYDKHYTVHPTAQL